MYKYILLFCVSFLFVFSAVAADLAGVIRDGSLWSMPPQDLMSHYLQGLPYKRSGERTLRLLTQGQLTIGNLTPTEMEWIFDEKQQHPASVVVMLYNKGDDGPIDKKAFDARVKSAASALTDVCGVKATGKNVHAQESGVRLKAWVWKWEHGAAMLEAHDTGRGKKNYEAEFIRLRFSPDAGGLERGGAADAGSRRDLAANVQRSASGDVLIAGIPMVDQGDKGYCLPATVARIFSYYGMDGVDMHALASLCDTRAGGGTTLPDMLDALEKIGSRFHVRIITFKDKDKRPSPADIVKAYNKEAKRRGLSTFGGFGGVSDRDVDAAVSGFDPEVLEASFPVKQSHFKKWFQPIYKSIDAGIPVLWAIPGHMRLIIGYNAQENLIYYSDTWGAGHEKKAMPNLYAYMITLYRGCLRLSK